MGGKRKEAWQPGVGSGCPRRARSSRTGILPTVVHGRRLHEYDHAHWAASAKRRNAAKIGRGTYEGGAGRDGRADCQERHSSDSGVFEWKCFGRARGGPRSLADGRACGCDGV